MANLPERGALIDSSLEIIEDGGVVIEKGKIIEVGDFSLLSKNNFDEEFVYNNKSIKTKEIKTKDENLKFLLNSEVNGLLVKTKYDLNQENSYGILMSDELENCIMLI